MATFVFPTNSGKAASALIPVSGDLSGATITIEFATTSTFNAVTLTKTLTTEDGRNVIVSLSDVEVDNLRDSHFRVKVSKGNNSYVGCYGGLRYYYTLPLV